MGRRAEGREAYRVYREQHQVIAEDAAPDYCCQLPQR